MEDALNDIKAEISEKQKEISHHENLAAVQFKEIAQNIGGYANKIKQSVATALGDFSSTVLTATNVKISSTNEIINTLKKEKMDQSAGDEIRASLDQFKKQVIDFQSKNMETISASNEKIFKDIVERMKHMLDNFEQNEVVNKTAALVNRQLDEKLNQQLKALSQQQPTASNVSKDQMLDIVKKELNTRLGPANLQSIISNLPEVQIITDFCKKLPPLPPSSDMYPDMVSVKEISLSVNKEMDILKQRVEETRSIVDSIRAQGLNKPGQSNSNSTNENEALAKMQAIERQVTLMHSNIKMIETALNTKTNALEVSSASRKRTRSNSDVDMALDDSIKSRLEEIESKHQKLLDFILQCKDNVLDDMFPTRLEAAMKKIERTLINHETFIAFIIDPFSTKKKREEIPMKNLSEDKYLNPGMIDCIQKLIKKATDEATAPLHEQIKSLQEQLNKK
ncbi:unnamed protein product [Rhizopus stolonifer]